MLRWLSITLVALTLAGPVHADAVPLTTEEAALLRELMDLYWAPSLSDEQSASVMRGLDAEHSQVLIEALRLVAIHRLERAAEKVDDLAENHPYAAEKAFAAVVAGGLRDGADMERALIAGLSEDLAGDDPWRNAEGVMKPLTYVRGMVSFALVVREARALRLGAEPRLRKLDDVPGIEVTPFDRRLLEYSAMPAPAAVDDILGKLAGASALGDAEYDLIAVLRTHRASAAPEILRRLNLSVERGRMTGYGKVALVGFLREEIPGMSPTDRARLRAALARLKSDRFAPLARAVANVESTLSAVER